MNWLKPFVDIYSTFGWIGIGLAILVLTIFVTFLCLAILIIYPKLVKIFKGDNYKSWDNMVKKIGDLVEKVGILEGELKGFKDMVSDNEFNNLNQHTKLFDKLDKIEDKVK